MRNTKRTRMKADQKISLIVGVQTPGVHEWCKNCTYTDIEKQIHLCKGLLLPFSVNHICLSSSGPHSSISRCPPNEYQCGGTELCIHMTKLCNGVPDCTDGWDEGPHCRGITVMHIVNTCGHVPIMCTYSAVLRRYIPVCCYFSPRSVSFPELFTL